MSDGWMGNKLSLSAAAARSGIASVLLPNEAPLMAVSRCERRSFPAFRHSACPAARYMNLQLCPSGWIQRRRGIMDITVFQRL